MNKFRDPVTGKQKGINWWPLVIVLLLFGVIVWVVYFFRDEKRFAVVKLYGDGPAINLSKSYDITHFSSGNKSKGAVLAETGDLLGVNNTFVYFDNPKHDSMQVDDKGDSLVFVNGKINCIAIFNNEELLPWFRTMKAPAIANLETIHFNAIIPEGYIPYLKEIARQKPNTALVFEEDDSLNVMDTYLSKADFFSPLFIRATVTQYKYLLLSRWKTVQCLYLDLWDSVVTASLPAMPALKECIIYGDDLQSIDASFFSNNKQLEKVTLIADLEDYALLEPLANLGEITINNFDKEIDLAILKRKLSKLSVLIVSGTCFNIDLLANYKNLRWLGLPENTNQQQFNNIATQLHGLQVLELQGSDSITRLEALQQMPNLRGLVITDTITDKKTLYAMQSLRYLSVPGNKAQDSAFILSLERALPGCIIVPNSGACLGSGWLLLLLPGLILLGFGIYKMQSK